MRSVLPKLLIALLVSAILALGVWHIDRFAAHVQATLAYPYPLDGQEGTLLYEARLLRSGEPLYQPLQPDRVVSAPYPPVHYVALAILERFTNPQAVFYPATVFPIFLAGRWLALAATGVVALGLGLSVWRIGRNLPLGLVAACVWLAFPPVQLWATRIKPDTLALAWMAMGLLAVAWYFSAQRRIPAAASGGAWRSRSVWLLPLAAAAFALAFFTKQTVVAAPAATALTLMSAGLVAHWRWLSGAKRQHVSDTRPGVVLHRQWRMAGRHFAAFLIFTISYMLLIAVPWLLLDYVTQGQFTFHVWGLHPADWWSFGRFRKYAGLLLVAWPLILIGLSIPLALVGNWLVRRRRPGAESTLSHTAPTRNALLFCMAYALIGTMTIVGAGTTGAHHNHLLEPLLALSLAGGSMAGAAVTAFWRTGQRRRGGASLLLLGLLLAQLWVLRDRPDWYDGEFDMRDAYGERFVALIMSQPGEVLADDVGLLLAAGRPLRYDDPATMGPAVRSGLWDQTHLLDEVADQRFSLILLPFDATKFDVDPKGRWSPEFIATLRQHYRLLYRDMLFSYVPREDDD